MADRALLLMKKTMVLGALLVFSSLAWAQEQPAVNVEPTPVAAPPAPEWSWAGDLRLRTQSEKNGDNHIRWNEKLRLRFGVAVKINRELNAEIRIATARSARSTNQGLGDSAEPAGARHFIGLDLAYVNYHPVSFA